jgi:membrane protein YqaA with SNARE-associated domain
LSLVGLFASSSLSATLLPGNSEIVLVAILHEAPALKWPALAVATIGNTLGGMTSYAIGAPPRGMLRCGRLGFCS